MRSIYVLAAFIGSAMAIEKHHNISQEIDAIKNSTIDESIFSNNTVQAIVVEKNMTKNSSRNLTGLSAMANKLNLAENKNRNLFDAVEKKLQDNIFLSEDDKDEDKDKKPKKALNVSYDPYENMTLSEKEKLSSGAKAGMSDDDVKCYEDRYSDVKGDARAHFMDVGQDTGRLGTCANDLTDYEAQGLIDRKPLLQRAYGKNSKYALTMAKQWYTDIGFKKDGKYKIDKWDNEADFCSDASTGHVTNRCYCPGTLYYGVKSNPITKDPIESLDKLREWLHVKKESKDYLDCSWQGMGLKKELFNKTVDMQCFCEYKPAYNPILAAYENEPVTCDGHVYFMQKETEDGKPSTWVDGQHTAFTVNSWNNTKKNYTCSADNFEGVDPLPGQEKACFCDDKSQMANPAQFFQIKQYWRSVAAQRQAEEEKQARLAAAKAAKEAARIEKERQEEEEKAAKEEEERARKRREAEEKAEREAAEAEEKARIAAAKKRRKEEEEAAKKALEKAKKEEEEARKREAEAEKERKEALKKKRAERRKLLQKAEREKKKAVKEALAAAHAEIKAKQEAEKAAYREELAIQRAERQRKRRELQKKKREAARLAEKKARLAKEQERQARERQRATERAAEAARIAAETERQIQAAMAEKEAAWKEKQKLEKERRANRLAKRKAEKLADEKEREAREQEAEKRQREAEAKAARLKKEAEEADKRAKIKEKAEQEERQKNEMEQRKRAAEEAAARDAKRKAEKALQLAKNMEEQHAAEAEQARAEAALKKAQDQKKQLQEDIKAQEEDMKQSKAAAEQAKEAQEKAEKEQKESEEAAKKAKEDAKKHKEKTKKEMAAAQKEAEEFEAELKRQQEADKKSKEAALKDQEEMLKQAAEAQEEARDAASKARSMQADEQKAYLAQQMTARIAQFEDMYSNTWSDGTTGLSMFQLTGDFDHSTEDDLIKDLLLQHYIADVEEYKMDGTFKVVFSSDSKMESHTEETKFIGLVYDDKIEAMTKEIEKYFFNKEHHRLGKFPAFDLATFQIATGDKAYLEWALKEKSKEKPVKDAQH